jgi:hypothetical protein
VDELARVPSSERRVYFEQAAAQLGLSPQLVEKDFWVCWSLRRLFLLDEFGEHLTFKGGTTLSKVYHVIERFSEDVDVAIERGFLGFGGDREPENAKSGKEQQRRIKRLKTACQTTIAERLAPQLEKAISGQLAGSASWSLRRDPADRDDQTLLFEYPPALIGELHPYFSGSVKIELGARSDHFPVENAAVGPYLSDVFPEALSERAAHVRVLAAERTFWEKATILHTLHHVPHNKQILPRMSRHYYDVFRMAQSPIWDRAMAAIHLLDRVAIHKSVFFKVGWANYDKAHLGTLRLTPSDHIVGRLKQDYLAMRPMFFSEPPPFEDILSLLPELENRINGVARRM